MLRELHIRGLGVIDSAEVAFHPGLNVVTGETGVGKTLIVTSIDLLRGGRGGAHLVQHDAEHAAVEAVMYRPEGECMVSRRITADGRSRAWIDGTLVPVGALADIGVELHGQGAGFALAAPSAQLAALDASADNQDVLTTAREAWDRLTAAEARLAELDSGVAEREVEILRFQVDELERADLSDDEDDRLGADIARLEHAERLTGLGEHATALAGPEGAAGTLGEAHAAIREAATIDPAMAETAERLGALALEATDLAHTLRAWIDGLDGDAGSLERLRERRALVNALKRKYGGTMDAVAAVHRQAVQRLAELEGFDATLAAARGEHEAAAAAVSQACEVLSERRRAAAADLVAAVRAELPSLSLPKARFDIEVTGSTPGPQGSDTVRFLFSASASGPLDALGTVASGGELARAMIAITLAAAEANQTAVLVFDEADQGLGGEAALDVGRRLERLGRSGQVLVVSHLPQLAAFADHHVAVERNGDDIVVRTLDDDARLNEISRMLAGLGTSDRARAHAAELLELAAEEKARQPSASSPS